MPRAFGRKPVASPPSVRRVPCALLAAGIAAMIAALGLTLTDAHPGAPFLVGLLAFALILTAILSLKEE